MEVTSLPDLASTVMGGAVISASDEFFASKDNLINADPPQSRPGEYTERGKWMDGWETRRRRDDGHDWCVIQLGARGVLRGAAVDTSYFEGNYPDGFSLDVCFSDGDGDVGDWEWHEVIPRTPLEGNKVVDFEMQPTTLASHARLNIFPDGGVARLRLYGHAIPDWHTVARERFVDLAAARNGGVVLDCSDRFFSTPSHLVLPGPSRGMWDGWETRRRRGPGHDWVLVKLAAAGIPSRVVVDTSHFHGNAPGWCWLEGLDARAGDDPPWRELVSERPLLANHANEFEVSPGDGAVTHVRLNIKPDGGVARLHVMGEVEREELQAKTLQRFNLLPTSRAEAEMLAVCGSREWADEVAAGRPYGAFEEMTAMAQSAWESLGEDAWLQAFSAHPRIGERSDVGSGRSGAWSDEEQASASRPPAAVARRLRSAQRLYEQRLGRTYLVAAYGKSSEDILADVEARLANEPDLELRVTAEQQSIITIRRLHDLFGMPVEEMGDQEDDAEAEEDSS